MKSTTPPREQAESIEQHARRRIAEMWSDRQLQGYGELSIEETIALIEAEYYGRLN